MMTSSEIRQSFLDFFKSKQHTIVPSSSLLPDSPNLLFTNAGMNQFVPIFLGQTKCPYQPGRAADTQKCIRAGGKHNDLEDVGLDTYHHTFFEMLGNWSFGDYFKKEAIEWAWELVVEKWKFPANRLYATVYKPGPGEPSEFDQEACDQWEKLFKAAGLDPKVHVCTGGKKDNFWMMGDTGPCGPCSELHVDLTHGGDTKGSLVNKNDFRCIEIWNLVFIQFNANADGTFSLLPARHVDTGMGFERVTAIIQGTKNFKDFAHAKISNYETDIFRPIFDELEKLSGKKYGSTLPTVGQASRLSQTSENNSGKKDGDRRDACPTPEQIALDIAFRVIADHIRTLGFAIADSIQPSNEGRGYVLRRILRRAVRYGRTLGFHEPFFYKLVDVLADTMGDVFPEIRVRKKHVQEVIQREEEAFNKTLDNGIEIFEANIAYGKAASEMSPHAFALGSALREGLEAMPPTELSLRKIRESANAVAQIALELDAYTTAGLSYDCRVLRTAAANIEDGVSSLASSPVMLSESRQQVMQMLENEIPSLETAIANLESNVRRIHKDLAFQLYDTYGFPLDLTELMARERGLTVDKEGFEKLMEEQRARARAAQKKTVISLSEIGDMQTKFVGYDQLEADCKVLNTSQGPEGLLAVVDVSPLYAEMGGQVGDTGKLTFERDKASYRILNTVKRGQAYVLKLESTEEEPWLPLAEAPRAHLKVDAARRAAIQRHHTVTHLLHWALHEVVNKEASQKGSFVGPDKLTFDFNSAPLTPQQVADVEKLVNERIVENAGVSWTEVAYADVKSRKDVMQFFGEKYGDTVRVVQIGGHATKLDGYSMELCGGTHTRATGEIGLFRIVGENAIAAGVRRIEAIAGLEAYRKATDELTLIKSLAGKVNSPVHELEKKIESLLEHQKAVERLLKAAQQREASNAASNLLEQIQTVSGIPAIIHNLGGVDGDFLQAVADSLKERFKGVIVLGGGPQRGTVALVAAVTSDYIWKVQAGKIIQQIAPIVGGKGGGKPDNARGGGKDAGKLDEALSKAKELLG